MQTCVECKGTGVFDRIDFDEIPCSVCNGAGELPDYPGDGAKPEPPKSVPKDAVCPYCKKGNDVTATKSGKPPVPGTVSVCAYCYDVTATKSGKPPVPGTVSVCAYCYDVTATKSGKPPVPGTVSVCAYCYEVSILGADMRHRMITGPEWEEIFQSPVWPHVVAMIEYAKVLRAMIDTELPEPK